MQMSDPAREAFVKISEMDDVPFHSVIRDSGISYKKNLVISFSENSSLWEFTFLRVTKVRQNWEEKI